MVWGSQLVKWRCNVTWFGDHRPPATLILRKEKSPRFRTDLLYFQQHKVFKAQSPKPEARARARVMRFADMRRLTTFLCFWNYRKMVILRTGKNVNNVVKYADMFSAMGTEARLRIMQLLLSAHPDGLVVGEIQEELEIPNSTLSHHLDKLKNEDLVQVSRESTFLRYTVNIEALQELLGFLYAECCTRNKAVKPQEIIQFCK